jgi:hypothetical protein
VDQKALARSSPFGSDEIRLMQMLVVLFSCLSPGSTLREILEYALALPNQALLSQITPVSDTSLNGLKTWLEGLWVHQEISPDAQKIVTWQRNIANVWPVVRDLKEIERRLGFQLCVVPYHIPPQEETAHTALP